MQRIILVRHGQSTANIHGIAGTTDATLTEIGKEQARLTGLKLRSEEVVTIVCSPLIRARETAEIIAKVLDLPTEEIVTIDELRERFLGHFEGTTGKPPEFFLNSDNDDGIESRRQLIDRVKIALDKLINLTKERGGTTIAISHGQISYYITQVSKGKTRFEDFDPPSELNNAQPAKIWDEEE